MRFPRLAHRSAAAHKLHSTPQQDRMNLISGKGETSSRLPAFSLFLPGSCPNYRDRRRRLLAPAAMRRAVAATSEAKVNEYPSEVTVLQPIFEKLRRTPGIETPLDQQTAITVGLTETDLSNLVKYGVFFEDNGQFEVPELFRIGLGFARKGARPNILA